VSHHLVETRLRVLELPSFCRRAVCGPLRFRQFRLLARRLIPDQLVR
jgi:hypothetical protein